MLLQKKNINKNSKEKTLPAYHNAKTEVGAEAAYEDDYYSTVNKDHISDRIEEDSPRAHALEDLRNSKELDSSQVYDDIDKDVKNVFIQPNAAKDEATADLMQMYSIVDMHAKKGKQEKQEKMNDADTVTCIEISDIYAVVDKNTKNKCQEQTIVDEYAVVDRFAKKKRQEQKNVTDEYAIIDRSAKIIN